MGEPKWSTGGEREPTTGAGGAWPGAGGEAIAGGQGEGSAGQGMHANGHGNGSAAGDGVSIVGPADLHQPDAVSSPAFFLLARDSSRARSSLRSIRQDPRPPVYLKPVVLVTDGGKPDGHLRRQVDAIWDRGEHPGHLPPALSSVVREIGTRQSALQPMGQTGDTQLALKLLRFAFTRQDEFRPVRTVRHPAGWLYPRLEPFLSEDPAEIASTLRNLESRRLMESEFVAYAHRCSRCACAFLNFQETCPDCKSTNLAADDILHHFRCAYTAPLAAFEQDHGLVCPKCDRTLRQIGVDYEKPSLIYQCRDCEQQFQEPGVTTDCYECGRRADPEVQVQEEIKSYRITALGENGARHGIDSSFLRILGRESRLLDYETFRVLVDGEAARIGRYGRSRSSLLIVRLQGMEKMETDLGERAGEVFEELTRTFTRIVRTSDYLTARNETLFLFLLTETTPEDARVAAGRLREGIRRLLEANLERPPRPEMAVEPVEGLEDLEATVEERMGHAAL